MPKSLILFLLLIPTALFGQVTITGKVINVTDKKPVPNASVFLSNASVGGKTTDDGAFILNYVKDGQYDLVVSCVGYTASHQTVMVKGASITLADIPLMPKVTELKEVTIKFDANRERHLQQFIAEFLGHSDNAQQSKIINPEIIDLDFDKATNVITASTTDFLIIENKALGYRVKYLLQSFELDPRRGFVSYVGSSIFEPLKGKKGEEKRWEKKRAEAYLGSSMHFLRSCITMQADNEKFKVLRLIRSANPNRPPDSLIKAKIRQFSGLINGHVLVVNDSLNYWSEKSRMPKIIQTLVNKPLNMVDYIKLTPEKGLYAFGYTDCLQISYRNRESQTSVVTFYKPYAYFDSNGVILNPTSNTFEGYWGFQRVADLLPVDYVLPEWEK